MNIAIIPARGGSKRIPRKNIRPFAGKPIIAYSIEAAKECGLFERIIVSTDDPEIAEVARAYGAEVPFFRPANLADDFTGTDAVLINMLEWLQVNDRLPDFFCCIYATAPFSKAEYIRQGLELLLSQNATTSFPVATFPSCIFRALKVEEHGRLGMVWPENREKRSQDFCETYHDAGQFYWGNSLKYLAEQRLYSANAVPVPIPRYLVQDIDNLEDWENAERMHKALNL